MAGFDFSDLPGGGGGLGALLTAAQVIVNIATCLSGSDWGACFESLVQEFLDPFDLWFSSVFSGRPKVGIDSATDDTALFYIGSTNPVIQFWGMNWRNIEALGIPDSSSIPAQQAYYTAIKDAALKDLKAQFDGTGRPPLTLNQGIDLFKGIPVNGTNIYSLYYDLGLKIQHPDSTGWALYDRSQLDVLYTQLVTLKYLDPTTGFPFSTQGGGGGGPPKKKIIPLPPGPDPENDELTDCCVETQAALAKLTQAVEDLGSGGAGGTGSSACCDQVVAAIGNVVGRLGVIASTIENVARVRPGVDLTPIVGALDKIAAELAGVSTGKPLQVEITNTVPLVDVKVDAPATDVSAIVAQLEKLVTEGDVAQTVLDYLTKQGFLTGEQAQVIVGAGWADAITGIFRTYGWNAIQWLMSWVGVKWNGKTLVLNSLGQTIAHDVAAGIDVTLDVGAVPLYAVVAGALEGVANLLNPTGPVSPGNPGFDPALLLAKTLGPVLIVNAATMILSFFDVGGGEVLAHWVEVVAGFTGFEEIKEIELGQKMQAGPIAAARLQAQKTYRQSLPGAGESTSWAARRLISPAAAKQWLSLAGFSDPIQPVQLEAAYSGISARQLIRLMSTGLFTAADINDEMQFAGMRPASLKRLQLAAPYLATDPQRKQLQSALETAYADGLYTDTELVDALDSADHNTNRNSLILNRVHILERVALVKAFESEYATAYIGNLITHDVYTANLAAIGLQQWKIDALAGVLDARKGATLARQMAAAEKALERATTAKERQAAMAAYSTGTINIANLVAALVATGLTAAQAAAWASLASLKAKGNMRWVYGLELPNQQAAILKQRVTALVDQRKHQLITGAQFVTAMEALKIPAIWINALEAEADATISSAKGPIFFPVGT